MRIYRRRAVVEMPSPHRHRRGATALFRNPVRGAKRMRAGILRILPISRAGGTPLLMAGRLTQLAKIISRDFIQPLFGGRLILPQLTPDRLANLGL